MSTPAEILTEAREKLRARREELQPFVNEYSMIGDTVDDLGPLIDLYNGAVPVEEAVQAPGRKPAPVATERSVYTPPATVTNIKDRRPKGTSKHSETGKKGGRPTKKVVFMRFLKESREIARDQIPQRIDSSAQTVNTFLAELVKDGMVKLEDRGNKLDPVEHVVITPEGLAS